MSEKQEQHTQKAWCSECRTMRRVIDQHDESYYAERAEFGLLVTDLSCGHESQTQPRIIGTGPGTESATEALAAIALRERQKDWSQ